jgi:hypothetical protein
MVQVLTPTQYQEIVNGGADYCDCCGGKFETLGLIEAHMPDEDDNLQGGYTVCHPCSHHAEDGPCQPDKLTVVRDPNAEDTAWVHRAAGMAAAFGWQDEGTPASVEYTKIVGKLPNAKGPAPLYVVHVLGTADSGHGYTYPIETHLTVTRRADDDERDDGGKPVIDDATDEQIAQAQKGEE